MLEYKTMIGMLSQKSNEPTKTKKAMKQTMKYLSIAALVVVGANMMSCNKVELSTEQLQEDKTTSNVVTLTTTVGLDGGATTRALTSGGVKTFAAGETIALVYKKTGGATAVAVSEALKDDGDIASGAKSATFTFTLEDPDNTQNVTYVYPAAMAKADGSINYDALDAQDGTLASLASNLDLATYTAAWNGTALPNVTLDNQLAILAITLKDNAATPSEITGDITGMTVSDGTNTYTVTRSAAAGPIYVAIQPTTSADIEVTATDGTKNYTKSLTGKTYAAGNGYSLSWRMAEAAPVSLIVNPAVGQVIGNDGKNYADAAAATAAGHPAVAMIAYVGSDNGEAAPYNHGLALAMSDAGGGSYLKWSTSTSDAGHTKQTDSNNFTSESGLQYNASHNSDTYPAFKAAIANNSTAAPTGCSAWFLASGYQWTKMFAGNAGGLKTLAGLESWGIYWSSSERSANLAWCFYSNDGDWDLDDDKDYVYLVRSCLAF